MDLGTLLEGKRVLTSTTLSQMESVGQLIRKLYKAYQFSNDRFWREADIYPSADFTQAPTSKVGVFIQSPRRLAHESRRSACIAAELPWSEGTCDGLTTDLVDLVKSVSSAMRFFGNCCSHNSLIASGATTSDYSQEIRESQHEKAFDVECRSDRLRCRFRHRNAGCSEGLRVLPTGRDILHALVRLRHFGPMPGHVVWTWRRLRPQSFSRWRRQRLRVRANCSQASPEITKGVHLRGQRPLV
jgi:hypothetical protein